MTTSGINPRVIEALCSMCSGEYETAIEQWRALLSTPPNDGDSSTLAALSSTSLNVIDEEDEQKLSSQTVGQNAEEGAGKRSEMIKHNLAVCLLYTGKIGEVGTFQLDVIYISLEIFGSQNISLVFILLDCSTTLDSTKL